MHVYKYIIASPRYFVCSEDEEKTVSSSTHLLHVHCIFSTHQWLHILQWSRVCRLFGLFVLLCSRRSRLMQKATSFHQKIVLVQVSFLSICVCNVCMLLTLFDFLIVVPAVGGLNLYHQTPETRPPAPTVTQVKCSIFYYNHVRSAHMIISKFALCDFLCLQTSRRKLKFI